MQIIGSYEDGVDDKGLYGKFLLCPRQQQNLQVIQRFLDEHGLEAEVELTGLRCCDKCAKGPNINIDGVEYNNIDQGSLLDILEKHFSSADKD